MFKAIGILITIVLTSFFIFPFSFNFLPSVNTKMAMAGLSIFILIFRMSKNGGAMVDRNIFYLSFIAISISMIGWASTLFNNTSDYTYSTYVISMWVWLGGAYTLIVTMMNVHNGVSVKLVCNYLIAASVGQCLIAIGMDYFPWLKNFVDSFLYGIGFMGKMPDRMYGVG